MKGIRVGMRHVIYFESHHGEGACRVRHPNWTEVEPSSKWTGGLALAAYSLAGTYTGEREPRKRLPRTYRISSRCRSEMRVYQKPAILSGG